MNKLMGLNTLIALSATVSVSFVFTHEIRSKCHSHRQTSASFPRQKNLCMRYSAFFNIAYEVTFYFGFTGDIFKKHKVRILRLNTIFPAIR